MKKEKGFSLVEVVIATGIMSVVAIGMSNLIQNQSQSISFLEDRLSKNDVKVFVTSKLSDGDGCTNTLLNNNVLAKGNIINLSSLKDKDNSDFIVIGDDDLGVYDRLEISEIELENEDVPLSLNATGMMKLRVFVTRQRASAGPLELAPVEIDVNAVVNDTTLTVESCNVTGAGSGGELEKACVFNQTTPGTTTPLITGTPHGHGTNGIPTNPHWPSTTQSLIVKDGESGLITHRVQYVNGGPHGTNYQNIVEETYTCSNKNLILNGSRVISSVPTGTNDGPEGPD